MTSVGSSTAPTDGLPFAAWEAGWRSANTISSHLMTIERPDSIHQLIEIMQAKKILETVSQQMDKMYSTTVSKQLEGKTLTPEQQQSIEENRARAAALMKEMLSWESMERVYLKVYKETFSQSEIDGMIYFYGTPTGRAVIAKLPLATQNTMNAMQEQMKDVIPKIQQLAKQTADQIEAAGTKNTTG